MIGPGNVQFSYAQLEGIWQQAGGNPQYANMAAAISMAESGGNSAAYGDNTNGTQDRGLWQINSSNGAGSTFDIMVNARTAVAMSNNGINWRPWCTAYSDGACGTKGGSYLGSGAPYQKYLQGGVPPDLNAPINGTAAAAGTGQTGSSTQATLTGCNSIENMIAPWLCAGVDAGGAVLGVIGGTSEEKFVLKIIDSLIGGILNPFIQLFAGLMGMAGGAILMGGGVFAIVRQTETYQSAKSDVTQAAGMAAFLAGPEAGVAAEGGLAAGGSRTSSMSRRVGNTSIRRTSTQQGPKPDDTAGILRAQAAMYAEQSRNYRAYLRAQPSRG